MTNFEYYKDQIFEIAVTANSKLAVVNGKPTNCADTHCINCYFYNGPGCTCFTEKIYKWLCSEYVEPIKLTSREHKLLEILETGYIARDSNGTLWWYHNNPIKGRWSWIDDNIDASSKLGYIMDKFSFIKFSDEKAWKVEDLLKLEVIE